MRWPDFLMVPHLGHAVTAALVDVVTNVNVDVPVMLVAVVVAVAALASFLLHAWTPSNHVCSNFGSPAPPQFLNQAAPGAQQVRWPDFLMVPHLGHVVTAVSLDVVANLDVPVMLVAEVDAVVIAVAALVTLLLHAWTPSNHVCLNFASPAPPQFLNQAPPGAQQLARPDFANVPHFGHIILPRIVEVKASVLIVVLTISSRSGNGRRVT